MLPRLLLAIGMTIGVMTPLLWAAYVSIPASGAPPQQSGEWVRSGIVRAALLEPKKARLTSSESVSTTSSIGIATVTASDSPQPKSDLASDVAPLSSEKAKPAPPDEVTSTLSAASALEETLQGTRPPDAGDAVRPGNTRTSSNDARPRQMADLAPMRDAPDVIDLYMAGGAHIIVVCSEQTRLQKLRMGCR